MSERVFDAKAEIDFLHGKIKQAEYVIERFEKLNEQLSSKNADLMATVIRYTKAHDDYMTIQSLVQENEDIRDAWLTFISKIKLLSDEEIANVTAPVESFTPYEIAKFWRKKPQFDIQTNIGSL